MLNIKELIIFILSNISFVFYFEGITVKAQTASMIYEDERNGGKRYLINLIDTPGHIDFSYEGTLRAVRTVRYVAVRTVRYVHARTVCTVW